MKTETKKLTPAEAQKKHLADLDTANKAAFEQHMKDFKAEAAAALAKQPAAAPAAPAQ